MIISIRIHKNAGDCSKQNGLPTGLIFTICQWPVITSVHLSEPWRQPISALPPVPFLRWISDSINLPFWKDLIVRESVGKFYEEGHLTVSDKPGLGIELNEDVCKANLTPGSSFFK